MRRRWFPTHQSLLAAIAGEGLRDLSSEIITATEHSDTRLIDMASAYIDFAARRPAMFTLIFRHDLLAESGANLRGLSQPIFARMVTTIRDTTDSPDPTEAGAALWAGIHGVAMLTTTGALHAAAPSADVRRIIENLVTATTSAG